MSETIPESLVSGPGGDARPVDESGKPMMAATEANWHEHVAAQRAAQAAAGDQGPEEATAALARAASPAQGKREIAGITFHPLDVGILWCLQKLGSVFATENPEGKEMAVTMEDISMAALVFADPDRAWALLDAGGAEELRNEAFKLARRLRREELAALTLHINQEMGKWGEAAKDAPPPAN